MIWSADATALLLKLWKDGGAMTDIADAMAAAGYAVSRNAIAGRLHRMKGQDASSTVRQTPPNPSRRRKVTKPKPEFRGRAVDPTPPTRRPITTSDLEALAQNEGVDYLENEGCKALLPKRSGKWQLQMCCGRPFGLDYNGSQSSYCPTHFRLFSNPHAAVRSVNG